MDLEKVEGFKQAILAAVEKAKAEGFKIICNGFGDRESKACCPIVALGWVYNREMAEDDDLFDLPELGTNNNQAWSFIWGFDGVGPDNATNREPEFFQLGKELRKDFFPD